MSAATEHWLRTLVEGMPQMVWRAVQHGTWTWSSPQWEHYTGQSAEESTGYGWLDVVHAEDRGAARQAWAKADEQKEFLVDLRVRNTSGKYRWFQTHALPIRGSDGSIVEWIGTSTDVDDLRRLQAEQRVLVAELQHRTRNLIAVVHSIAEQTVRGSTSLDDFQDRFDERLSALSRVQGLLSQSEYEPITIGQLIELELQALAGSRKAAQVMTSGDDIAIRSTAVQTLALAIHELATNALKYGALSGAGGRLSVSWIEHSPAGKSSLQVRWHETGLAPLTHRDPERIGYGRILIEQALPHQLGAATTMTFGKDELTCVIDLPLASYGSGHR